MAKDNKSSQSSKVRKKKWVSVKAPKFLNEAAIGDVPVYEEAQLIGKVMPANMMTLIGDPKKQATTMKFLITDAKAGVANTTPLSIEVLQNVIKRNVRRNKDKVEESLVFLTKDGVKVRIKPVGITNSKAKSSVLKALRHKLVRETHAYITSSNYEEIFTDILGFKVQRMLKERLSKIFPLKIVEIKKYEKESDKAKISKLPTKEEKTREPAEKDAEEEAAPKEVAEEKTKPSKKTKRLAPDEEEMEQKEVIDESE